MSNLEPTFREKFKKIIDNAPQKMNSDEEITLSHITKLFDFIDQHSDNVINFLYYVNKNYSKNIKKDHQAKLQFEEIVTEVNILDSIVQKHFEIINKIINDQSKEQIEMTKLFNRRRFILSYNNIITQTVNSTENLIRKINESLNNLFTATNNNNNNYMHN